MLTKEEINTLIESAKEARELSYSPYSRLRVGAAVLTTDNQIFKGCNVENASFGLTAAAETIAIFSAVSEGKTNIKAVAIVFDNERFGTPCAASRQVIREFGIDIDIIMAKLNGEYNIRNIKELVPYSFGPDNLGIV